MKSVVTKEAIYVGNYNQKWLFVFSHNNHCPLGNKQVIILVHIYIWYMVINTHPQTLYNNKDTTQMLAASWGEPEAYCHAVGKHSTCRLYNTNCICSMQ